MSRPLAFTRYHRVASSKAHNTCKGTIHGQVNGPSKFNHTSSPSPFVITARYNDRERWLKASVTFPFLSGSEKFVAFLTSGHSPIWIIAIVIIPYPSRSFLYPSRIRFNLRLFSEEIIADVIGNFDSTRYLGNLLAEQTWMNTSLQTVSKYGSFNCTCLQKKKKEKEEKCNDQLSFKRTRPICIQIIGF